MKQKIKNRIKNKLNLKLESRFNFQVTETGKLMSNLRSSEEDFSNFSFNSIFGDKKWFIIDYYFISELNEKEKRVFDKLLFNVDEMMDYYVLCSLRLLRYDGDDSLAFVLKFNIKFKFPKFILYERIWNEYTTTDRIVTIEAGIDETKYNYFFSNKIIISIYNKVLNRLKYFNLIEFVEE